MAVRRLYLLQILNHMPLNNFVRGSQIENACAYKGSSDYLVHMELILFLGKQTTVVSFAFIYLFF